MCQIIITSCIFAALICCCLGVKSSPQDPKCLLPMDAGPCRMKLDRYYYNQQTKTCEPFQFGGCRGNDNKFGFLQTCIDACVSVPASATVPSRDASFIGQNNNKNVDLPPHRAIKEQIIITNTNSRNL